MKLFKMYLTTLSLLILLTGCDNGVPLSDMRYEHSDQLLSKVEANVTSTESLEKVLMIDHSRLGTKAGSQMPPAKVLMFSNPHLETALIKQNPLVAIDLPLRVLAYEQEPGGDSKLIYNSFDYIESRFGLNSSSELRDGFAETMTLALDGIEPGQIAFFKQNDMKPDGITTIDSSFDFKTTIGKIMTAIDSQDDTVSFGVVDFQEQALGVGEEIRPSTLILFGGPGPGAKAMKNAPTLGLDAFCQKFLVWQDEKSRVHLSFNDLLSMAERQDVSKSIALRVINFRLNKVFEEALEN